MYCFFLEENTSILKKYKSLFFDKEIETEIIDIKSNNFFYKTNGSIKEFLHIDKRLHIPEGVKQSIFRMREKEISYILCNQKYTCKLNKVFIYIYICSYLFIRLL